MASLQIIIRSWHHSYSLISIGELLVIFSSCQCLLLCIQSSNVSCVQLCNNDDETRIIEYLQLHALALSVLEVSSTSSFNSGWI